MSRALSIVRHAIELVRLLRPVNVVLFACGTLLGGFVAVGPPALLSRELWWTVAAASLVGAASNAINDVFDLEIDRVNRPGRPLPLGSVSVLEATILWGVVSAFGVGLAASVSLAHGLVATACVALLFAYSVRFKRIPAVGNLVVATVVSAALPFGAMAVGTVTSAVPAALFAFLVTLAREIVKDVEDLDGDLKAGARTFAIVRGPEKATRTALLLVGLTAVAAPLPSIALGYPDIYLLLLVPTCGTLLIAATYLRTAMARAAEASLALKTAMVFGMLALAAAAI